MVRDNMIDYIDKMYFYSILFQKIFLLYFSKNFHMTMMIQ